MISISSLKVTSEIIEYLSRTGASPAKVIAQEIDRPKSTVYDHLNSLQKLNYVVKEGSDYRLSSKLLWTGVQARDNLHLYNVAKEEIDGLAQRTGEHAALFIEENNLAVMLYTSAGDDAIQISQYDGMAFPMHCGAPGKVILAHYPGPRTEEIIDEHGLRGYTENTITDRETLYEELEEIRNQGYGVELSEHLNGVRAIAVPVSDNSGNIAGAITVYGPASRFEGEYFTTELLERLTEAANIIEVNYAY